MIADLKSFGLSAERGFLPAQDPLWALPARFAAWEELARDLPQLLLTGRVRSWLAELKPLPVSELSDDAERRRAMLLLSYLGHAWVWSGEEPGVRIPRGIAVPWCEVAVYLGRPPVLSYASYALGNWRRIDPDGPVALGNLMLLQNFLGGADEDWFIGVHIDIEFKAAPILRELGPALDDAQRENLESLERRLERIARGIETLVTTLLRMPEHCDPYVYYRRVRPYIHGWRDHPALPNGVIYDGAFDGKPQFFRGETGAQSGIVPALDAALGVVHGNDPLRAHLMEMRAYMPPAHRAFIEAIEAAPSLRACVEREAARSPALREAYNESLRWLEAFRSTHLEYAARYIQRQSEDGPANPTRVGTGGTPFMTYLRKHRDETAASLLPSR